MCGKRNYLYLSSNTCKDYRLPSTNYRSKDKKVFTTNITQRLKGSLTKRFIWDAWSVEFLSWDRLIFHFPCFWYIKKRRKSKRSREYTMVNHWLKKTSKRFENNRWMWWHTTPWTFWRRKFESVNYLIFYEIMIIIILTTSLVFWRLSKKLHNLIYVMVVNENS